MVGRRATPPISSFCRKTTQNLLPYALYFKRTVAWICVMQARGWCLQHITRAAASTPPPPYLVFQVSLFKRAETGKMTSCSVEDGFLSQSTRCAHVRSSRTCSARRPSDRPPQSHSPISTSCSLRPWSARPQVIVNFSGRLANAAPSSMSRGSSSSHFWAFASLLDPLGRAHLSHE